MTKLEELEADLKAAQAARVEAADAADAAIWDDAAWNAYEAADARAWAAWDAYEAEVMKLQEEHYNDY